MAEMESDQRNIWGGIFLFKNAYLGDHEYVDICVCIVITESVYSVRSHPS